ncbi:HalD/BesD family halogenase [Aliiroseovarius sp.]|uniref:HalD/BesD family halogenase n=1 Tax=Aliiroseovarius sp. TaxID=1872442 RepID=UPI003BA8AA62
MQLIDLGKYPIDLPESPAYARMLSDVQGDLAQDGCAVLKGFLTSEGVAACVAEADGVADRAHASGSRTNVYFSQPDDRLPASHPVNRFFDRSNGFVAADNFAKDGPLRQVHDFPGFDDFIRQALNESEARFFRYADPLADVIVNTAGAGNGFPWHFDTNNFTVTLALQNAEAGGEFEYAPNLRSIQGGGEEFAAVQAVLDGERDQVRSLVLEPGDLQLFRGRYSLHRVAPLKGKRARHVAIFSYVEMPDMVGSPERTRQLYGRVLPVHLERAGQRADEYMD